MLPILPVNVCCFRLETAEKWSNRGFSVLFASKMLESHHEQNHLEKAAFTSTLNAAISFHANMVCAQGPVVR